MGRPRIYHEPRIATAVRIPASLRQDLQAAASERKVSVNLLITRAISEYLRRHPPFGVDGSPDIRRHVGRTGDGTVS